MSIRNDRWEIIGPGGGGATFLPTINPHDNCNVITVCDMTGAYITYDAGESWREFNLKARVDAVAFDPVDGSTIYAGSSGLFRSTDKGRTWRLVYPDPAKVTGEELVRDEAGHIYVSDDNWPGGEVHGIAIDPVNTDIIHICINRQYGDGALVLYSSFDRGRSWAETGELKGKKIHKLYIGPSSPNEDRRMFVFTDEAIHLIKAGRTKLEQIRLPHGTVSVINAGCGVSPASGSPVFFLLTPSGWEGRNFHSGLYRSTDFGQNWEELAGGLDDDLHGPENGQSRKFRNIGVCGSDCRTVWVDVWRDPFEFFLNPQPEMNYLGIMVSSDMGETWQWSMKTGMTYPDNWAGGWQERGYSPDWYGGPLGMSASPTNPDICWITGYFGNYRTLDGGRTWRQNYSREYPEEMSSTTRGIDVTTCYGVHFDPFDPKHMAISYTDIGLSHSHDGGSRWKHTMVGVPRQWINTCYWLVFDPEVKGLVWSVWSYSHDLPRFKMFRSRYFETSPGGVCRSEDGMETWNPVLEGGIPENCSPVHIVLDPASPLGSRTLYVAAMGRGVYKTKDDGCTWVLKNNGLSGNLNAWRLVLLPDGTLFVLIFSDYKNGKIIDGRIFKSTDGAESWQEVPMPQTANAPSDLQFDPTNPSRMYLSCWPRSGVDYGPRGGLFRTEDDGASWKRIFASDAYAYAIAVHPENPDTIFFASFDGSVRRSDNRGESWRRLKGFNFKWGHRPILDPNDPSMLYVTTFGSSVWHGPADGDEGAAEDILPSG